ncbi:MAG: hypothetical protein JJE25_08810 [Bacteroidia bacterium]|nr:hypothetical protein [Bacteroidia bacterium]
MNRLRDMAVEIVKNEKQVITAEELKKQIHAKYPDSNPSTLNTLLSKLEVMRPEEISKPFRGAYIYKNGKK